MQFLFKTESFSLFELPIFQLPGLGVNFATSRELQKLVHVLLVAEMSACAAGGRNEYHIQKIIFLVKSNKAQNPQL